MGDLSPVHTAQKIKYPVSICGGGKPINTLSQLVTHVGNVDRVQPYASVGERKRLLERGRYKSIYSVGRTFKWVR